MQKMERWRCKGTIINMGYEDQNGDKEREYKGK